MSERATTGAVEQAIAQTIADAIWDKKGFELVALEVTEIAGYTDMMVICSASSVRHASAIGGGVMDAMRSEHGRKPMGKEGERDGHWVLIDFGEVVVHIFHAPVREYYELDRLYADAPKRALVEPDWLAQAERERLFASASDWDSGTAHDPSSGEADDFEDSDLEDSDLEDSDLEDSHLEDSHLEDSHLEDRDLEDRDLEDSHLEEDAELSEEALDAATTPDS